MRHNISDRAGGPSRNSPQPARQGKALWIARRVAAAVAECHEAQRHLSVIYASADRHLSDPDRPPENYQEFLFRTSGPLWHEPAADDRARGQLVR
jgi:hypothetical protein